MKGFSRRRFLIGTGWVAGGATILFALRRRATEVAPTLIIPDEAAGHAWLQMLANGKCRFYFPRIDMGQNANTGLAQIVVEELNLTLDELEGIQPSTDQIPPAAVTAGSMSLTAFSRPVALAAATMREHLRLRASERFGVPFADVADAHGGFRASGLGEVSYVDIVSPSGEILEADDARPVPRLYSFDAARRKTQVGRSAAPLGIRELVTGGAVYAADVSVPDLLFGRAVLPPVRSARIGSVDASGVAAVTGYVALVQEDDFVGVVCRTPGAVDRAMARIHVEWALREPIDQSEIERRIDVDAELEKGDLEHQLRDIGHRPDVDWDIDLRFDVQAQSHAAQEPRAAIARFNPDSFTHRLEIWTGSQDPFGIRRFAAMDAGLNEDDVRVHSSRLGGGFGGREHYEAERDAVRLARAVRQPVKVQWTREDEFTASRSRPPSAHRIRVALDDAGNLSDWWHAYVTGHVVLARERLPAWLLPIARLAGDMGVEKGADSPYQAPHQRVECRDVDLPIDLGVWRSLNGAPATFARESTIDELAIRLGRDPVAYRIAQLGGVQPRLQLCLERVQEMAQKHAQPGEPGHGRGFACGIFDQRCFVAVCADVRVDHSRKRIEVLRMCCAQDVGMAVNPDQLKAQIESNMAWSVGMALLERLEVGDDTIRSSNFDDYPIVRMQDMPRVDAQIIDQPDVSPAGAGEVALIAGPPAIANAIRNATGFRARKLPIAYADLA